MVLFRASRIPAATCVDDFITIDPSALSILALLYSVRWHRCRVPFTCRLLSCRIGNKYRRRDVVERRTLSILSQFVSISVRETFTSLIIFHYTTMSKKIRTRVILKFAMYALLVSRKTIQYLLDATIRFTISICRDYIHSILRI